MKRVEAQHVVSPSSSPCSVLSCEETDISSRGHLSRVLITLSSLVYSV